MYVYILLYRGIYAYGKGAHEIQNDRYDVIKILVRRAGHARVTNARSGRLAAAAV